MKKFLYMWYIKPISLSFFCIFSLINKVATNGNWMHIKYQSKLQAKKVIAAKFIFLNKIWHLIYSSPLLLLSLSSLPSSPPPDHRHHHYHHHHHHHHHYYHHHHYHHHYHYYHHHHHHYHHHLHRLYYLYTTNSTITNDLNLTTIYTIFSNFKIYLLIVFSFLFLTFKGIEQKWENIWK